MLYCDISSADSDEAFETLSETLKSLSESAKSINDENDISEEELSRLWNKLGVSNEGNANGEGFEPAVFSLVTNLMQNLLSKQVLYPSIKDLSERVIYYFIIIIIHNLFLNQSRHKKIHLLLGMTNINFQLT